MTIQKYSKSNSFYFDVKKDFFSDNDELLAKATSQNNLYAAQPIRDKCKLCLSKLEEKIDFTSHGVEYIFCNKCGHLNGRFDDTLEFMNELYIDDAGAEYSKAYLNSDYLKRMESIYIQKVDFLTQHLPAKPYSVLDVGCGAGYFVAACKVRNINANGIDVNQSMVAYGNKQILSITGHENALIAQSENAFLKNIEETTATVVSAIGVIEHFRDPQSFFNAFEKSQAKYLYYSVPMFSFSALLENVVSEVFPRQLFGDHTHLFTESSLAYMHQAISCNSIAEWRFGTDSMDLYRSLMVILGRNGASDKMIKLSADALTPLIDDLQRVFDKSHFCSEIHCLIEKE